MGESIIGRQTGRRAVPAFEGLFIFLLSIGVTFVLASPGHAVGPYFVNDTSTLGDSFTAAIGADTNSGTSPSAPFRTVIKAMASAVAGETIYVDAGLFDSYTIVNGSETAGLNIDKDSIAIIGKDSDATVIDPPGASGLADLFGIYADTHANLIIKSIGVTGANIGIKLVNVDRSTVTEDSASGNGSIGILLFDGSDTNVVSAGDASLNTSNGIRLDTSSGNAIRLNRVTSNSSFALWLRSSPGNSIDSNTVSSNSNYGIYLAASSGNALSGNLTNSNASSGIVLFYGSDTNSVTANSSETNTNYGVNLNSSHGNRISGNTASGNTSAGIVLDGSRSCEVKSNRANSNTDWGIWLDASATNNLIWHNIADTNGNAGFRLAVSADTNTLVQNSASGNDTGVHLLGSSRNNIVTKNNLTGNDVSNVFNATGIVQTLSRNWFGSTDSVAIKAKIGDATGDWDPWRLGQVDTLAGADTTAPKAPDSVAIVGAASDTSIILEWTAVTANEESSGGAVGLTGYRVYRSTVKDTSIWLRIGQTTSGIRYQDTDAALGRLYYYRVTSFDSTTFENESFYSDSQPFDSAVLGTLTDIFVNDSVYSSVTDSFTYAAGHDTTGLGTRQQPFASIPRALQFATPGDTIWVDAGSYDSYMSVSSTETAGVHILNDSITIIGKDSASTIIDPPGPKTLSSLFGIYALNRQGLAIKNLAITGAYEGIRFDNTDFSTIAADSISGNGTYGLYFINAASSNSLTDNFIDANGSPGSGSGVEFNSNSDSNTVKNNRIRSNGYGGITLSSATNIVVIDNTIDSNTEAGIYVSSSNRNRFSRNFIRYNVKSGGIYIQNSDSNTADQNIIVLNDTGVFFAGSATGNVVSKNNFDSNTVSHIRNTGGLPQTLTRNWFGSADSVAIKNKITDTAGDWDPWRLGQVDTAAGADTTSPKAPDSVVIIGSPSDTSIIIQWEAVGSLEESNGGSVGLSAYRVYRSAIKDTSVWTLIGRPASGVTRWQDTDIQLGRIYHYRVTALDAASFENESFFSDSQPSDSAILSGATNLFVNDTNYSVVTDSFTYAVGNDTTGLGTRQKPFASIPRAMQFATSGDTIWIDAGLFDSYVAISSTETAGVSIDKDSITLIGKDSNATVIDPPGSNALSTLYGIYAINRTGLVIKNLGITGVKRGFSFNNVDLSTLDGDSVSSTTEYGIYLQNLSDTNTLKNCEFHFNSTGIGISNSYGDTFTNCISNSNTSDGIYLNGASHTVTNSTTNSNSGSGINLTTNWNSAVSGNTCDSNGNGIYVATSSDTNTISNNTGVSNTTRGISMGSSQSSTLTGNTFTATQYGITLNSCQNITLAGNTVNSNSSYGFEITGSSRNTFLRNVAKSNTLYGVYLDATSVDNLFVQNTLDSNVKYQVYIVPNNGGADTFLKNNILPSPTNPDSGVYNSSGKLDFSRNWWGRTDSAAIGNMVFDTAGGTRSLYQPFRLGLVDTTAGGDTTAPKAPDSVAIIGAPSDTSLIVQWEAVASLEESYGGAVGLSGYRVYRSSVKDTSSWVKIAQTGSSVTRYQDTDVGVGTRFYYRVTAVDAATFENESYFSDSQPSDSVVSTSTKNWYVNDTWINGATDSFTYAGGSDTSYGLGTAARPFRTITRAMQFVTSGDTIWIDAGFHDSFTRISSAVAGDTGGVVITVDTIALIGVDSGASVIDPPGDKSVTNLIGIYAQNRTGLLIKNLGVTGVNKGIYLENVRQSKLSGDSVSGAGNYAFDLNQGSASNTLENNMCVDNSSSGFVLGSTCQNNTLNNNYIKSNAGSGIWFSDASLCTATNNTIASNAGYGVYLHSRADTNVVSGNTFTSNNYGVYIYLNSRYNTLAANTVTSCSYGIYLDHGNYTVIEGNVITSSVNSGITLGSASHGSRIMNNKIRSNGVYGLNLPSDSNTTVIQNEFDSNAKYQIYITGSVSDTFQKNNFRPSPTNPDSAVYNNSTATTNKFTFTRNWWNSTDTGQIRKMIFQESNGDSVIYLPFRLGLVDTTAGGDSTAPIAPDSVAVVGSPSDTSIILSWNAVSSIEESNGGAVALSGYRVYRSKTKDTSSWTRIAQPASGVTRYQDTDVKLGTAYYYRVTAFDTATFENESFFSDSQPFDSAQAQTRTKWYVNDNSLSNDTYTGAVGNDTTGTGDTAAPFGSIKKTLTLATAGDTIFVDAGTYAETAVIVTDSIWIQGRDSSQFSGTILNPGDSTTSNNFALYGLSVSGLVIKDIRITGSLDGIRLSGVGNSRIDNVTIFQSGGNGVGLLASSTGNTVTNVVSTYNSSRGFYVESSANNTLSNLTSSNNGKGVYINSSSTGNTLKNSTVASNSQDGVFIESSSSGNSVENVLSELNSWEGFRIISANNNILKLNTSRHNTLAGFRTNSGGNVFMHNLSFNNAGNGFELTSATTHLFFQNTADSNLKYAFYIDGASSSDTFNKNNILPSQTNPDSGLSIQTTTQSAVFDFKRNYWNTVDSGGIRAKIGNGADSAAFSPFRFAVVDTTAGGDTTAPKPPDSVVIVGSPSDTSILVQWEAVSALDESNGGAVALSGYRVYRSKTRDTSYWPLLVQVGSSVSRYEDTDISMAQLYYYRVTAFDTATLVNESFFSDSQPFDSAVDDGRTSWFVNDTSYQFFTDSFTYAIGSDTQGAGTAQNPFRTIMKALSLATPGDTIFVDVGLFTETVVIEIDSVSIIGKDSAATVIDPPGLNATAGLYGIYADTQTGLLIKSIGVLGGYEGIRWVNVDLSTISGDSLSSNGQYGIHFLNGSDTNTISSSQSNSNQYGIWMATSSNNNTISNNILSANNQDGVILNAVRRNTITGNTLETNVYAGVEVFSSSSTENLITLNVVRANQQFGIYGNSGASSFIRGNLIASNTRAGISLDGSGNNIILQNDISANDSGIYIRGGSSGNVISKNNILSNRVSDIYNQDGIAQTLTRNWFGTANETTFLSTLNDTASAFKPYRLGIVDTAAGADTTAPASPTGDTVDNSTAGQVKVTWIIPALNEETNGGAVAFAGVKVYRISGATDTTHWANALAWTAGASDTTWTDTTVTGGDTYYYRLTSRDTANPANESYFTDTKSVFVVAPSFTVTSPNGGEALLYGETPTITWSTAGTIPNVKIEYSSDSGQFFTTITSSTANTNSYVWDIPSSITIAGSYRIRVSDASDGIPVDTSDANFSIRSKFLLTRPDGGDSFQAYTSETITWTNAGGSGKVSNVRLEYSIDSGSTWSNIVGSTFNSGSYQWTVANETTSFGKVRVSSDIDTPSADTSNGVFMIWPRAVPPPPDTISIVSGNHQLGRVSTACSLPLTVRVVDTGGINCVQDAKVTFLISLGSGASLGATALTTTSTYTDASGNASETLVLGSSAGVYRVEARNDSVTPARSVYFTAYADGRDISAASSTAGQGWRMAGPNKRVSGWNIKSAAGGLQNAKVYEWRAADADVSSLNNTKYYEPGGDAVRGRAYWIKDVSGGRLFVPTEGVAGDTFDTVSVRLSVGWNQIASGHYFYVNWDSGVAFDSSPVSDTPLSQSLRMLPHQAGDTRQVIQNKVYWYTGSNYVYGPASETSSLVTMQLKPMVGFWLHAYKACTMFIYPNPASPETYASEILNQAPAYSDESTGGDYPALSAVYKQSGKTASEADWAIQLIASASGITDWQNFVGVKPSAEARMAANALEAPAVAQGYLSVSVRPAAYSENGAAPYSSGQAAGTAAGGGSNSQWMAASFAGPGKAGLSWDVRVSGDQSAATLSWDNVSNLPHGFDAYLIGGPTGPVNLRASSSIGLPLASQQPGLSLILAVGPPEFLAPFLASPLSKELTFAFPNPGPDGAGNVTFKFNLNGAADVSILIFDVGGRLVREIKSTGLPGSNTVTWDASNRAGQKVGSGVYLYKMESGGTKFVDKLAIVR